MTNPQLDAIFDAMTTWGYVFVVTKENEGFWAHTDDSIHYRTNVLAELQQKALDLLKSRQYGDEQTVKKLINRLRMYTFALLDEFRPDDRIIPFENGVYYIDQHQFLPRGTDIDIAADLLGMSPMEYQYKTFSKIPHAFSIDTQPVKEWDDFVNLIFNSDAKTIQTFYEWIGYCLTTKVNKKKFLLIIGPKDSGKTTITRIALHAIGQNNYSLIKFAQICSNDTFVRYGIIDMRVNLDDDIGKSKIENIDEIKDLTGGLDYIWVNPKHEKPYKHYHITRFWCLCNKIPYIKDLDIPIAGRFLLLRAKHVFSNTDKCPECNELHAIDDSFESRMKTEPVAEYIIQRAISALHDLISRQSFVSQSDVEILDILRLELEPVYAFINKFCATGVDSAQCTPQPELYDKFVEYLDDEGTRCFVDTQRKFTAQMASYGYRTMQTLQSGWDEVSGKYDKKMHRKIYKGIALKDKVFFAGKRAESVEEEGKREKINPFEL
jgi:phage/plasmid-associated DNA primase